MCALRPACPTAGRLRSIVQIGFLIPIDVGQHWWIRWVTLIHLIGLCKELSTMPTLRCQDPRTDLCLLWTCRQYNFIVVSMFMWISTVLL